MTTRLFAVLLACLVALPGIAEAGPGRALLSTDLQDEVRKGNRRPVEAISTSTTRPSAACWAVTHSN